MSGPLGRVRRHHLLHEGADLALGVLLVPDRFRLPGLPITSLDGKRLGALDDLIVETTNWSIAALALDSGGEVDLSKDAVFGEDTILLQKGALSTMMSG